MSDLNWQPLPLTKYGIQYTCKVNGYIITTSKSPKTELYSFTVCDVSKRGKEIFNSAVDPFTETTNNYRRVMEIAERWVMIKEGSR